MGFHLFRKKEPDMIKSPPSHNISITLTQTGREKAEAMSLKSPYFEVLCGLLEAGGTANYSELATQTHWPVTKVEAIAKDLGKSGYVKQIKT